MKIAQAWLLGTGDLKIMPAARHRNSLKRPLWIIALVALVCVVLIGTYTYAPQHSSACNFLSSNICGPPKDWHPPKHWYPPVPARIYADDELSARVVIRDILSMPSIPSKNPKIAFMFLTPGSLPFEKLWEKFFLVQLLGFALQFIVLYGGTNMLLFFI